MTGNSISSGRVFASRGGDEFYVSSSQAGDWMTLLKPRVIQLVVFTGLVGVLLAPGHINPVLGFTAVLCIATGAGAAGAINMWFDRDIDGIMRRTSGRPIPAGDISPGAALLYGVMLAGTSVIVLYLATNVAAAVVLAVSILFYVLIYTAWLKRLTPNNIVIGGAAGAFPPLIGWAAVTGGIEVMPLFMFGIIFLWTPPHFWALSLYTHDDYARAGVPMLPVVSGARVTRQHVVYYTIALVLASIAPWCLRYTGLFYGTAALCLGGWFLVSAWFVLKDKQDGLGKSLTNDLPARRTFRYSLIYLFSLFAALAVDHWLW